MPKNGITTKVLGGSVLIIIGAIVAVMFNWGPSIQDNAHAAEVNKIQIKQVDKKVDRFIIRQEAFMDRTSKSVSEIEKHTAAMRATVKAHHP